MIILLLRGLSPRKSVGGNMTIPSILFALIIASFYGVLYHLIRNGGFWRLIFCLGLSVIGFAAGHLAGYLFGWLLIPLGSLNLGLSSIGSLIFLVGGDWLSRIEVQRESKV
jgi:hypothetical protein